MQDKVVEVSPQVVNKPKDIELPKDNPERATFLINLSREEQVSVVSKLNLEERLMCVKEAQSVNQVMFPDDYKNPKNLFEAFNFKQTGVVVMGGPIDTIERARAWVPKNNLSIEKFEEGLVELWT